MKKKIILIVLIITLVIIAGIGGYFIYQSKQKTGTEWGDLYRNKLLGDSKEQNLTVIMEDGKKEEKTIDYYKNTKNVNISFIELDKEVEPVMTVGFERDNGKKSLYVYSIDEYNEGGKMACISNPYPQIDMDYNLVDSNYDYDVVFLYNIAAKEYRYYV